MKVTRECLGQVLVKYPTIKIFIRSFLCSKNPKMELNHSESTQVFKNNCYIISIITSVFIRECSLKQF